MQLALFDFDGTITEKDSFLDFIAFTFGKSKLYSCLFFKSPLLIANRLGLINSQKAKESVLSHFIAGMPVDEFTHLGNEYCQTQIENIVKKEAREMIAWHQSQGHRIIVVSASVRHWLQPWCDKHKLELVCTDLSVLDNKLTGKIEGLNCKGQEKVNRLKTLLNLEDYEKISAYGDSSGDKEMLDIADEKFYRTL